MSTPTVFLAVFISRIFQNDAAKKGVPAPSLASSSPS